MVERIDETIDLARKMLKKNGYSHDDIDRVVFIGGPTKMPLVRDRGTAATRHRGRLQRRPDDGGGARRRDLRREPRLDRSREYP